jgi:hypothetical protein
MIEIRMLWLDAEPHIVVGERSEQATTAESEANLHIIGIIHSS